MGFQPYHFWQLAGPLAPTTPGCNSVVYEYAWQNADAAGRHEIRQSIETAEERVSELLGYPTAPQYFVETHPYPRYPDIRFDRVGYAGSDYRWIPLQLNHRKIQSVGTIKLDLLATEPVVYTDSDGDGIYDSFSVSTATTVTDVNDIAIYFQASDRINSDPVSDEWRILPVTVSITGGIATIKGKSWLLARPILYQGIDKEPLDASDIANYVTDVEIYHRYVSSGTGAYADAQAILIWESRPYPAWAMAYPVTSTDPAAVAYATARVGIRDYDNGIVSFGEAYYDAVAGDWKAYTHIEWWRPPDRVEVRYTAGVPLVNQRVNAWSRTLVARAAAAEMNRPICACEAANRELYNWQFDLSRAAGANDEQYSVSSEDIGNPLGSRRGHAYAWKEIKTRRVLKGFCV